MAIEILEIHHTGVRIDTGAEKLDATKGFYKDVLGLPHDTGRPTIPGIPGAWINVGEVGQIHLIGGAGISGVGGAYHLTQQLPGTSFVVLESQESFGGTWLTHKYPGIRSDSDLFTFGYRFKPWTGAPIATAEEILSYMGEVIDENDLGRHIRYRHTISSARWSSKDNLWTIDAVRTDTGEPS